MTDNDSGPNEHGAITTDGTATERSLAETLAALEDEAGRLERQSSADHIEIDYADELGGASLTLTYHDIGGDD